MSVQSSRTGDRRRILVGVNDYVAPIPRLKGCLNDIRLVEKYLRAHVGAGASSSGDVQRIPSNLSVTWEGPLHLCVLFSACTSVQTAGDTPTGGIFTTSLLEALNTASGPLNYADLFMRTRVTVKRARKAQLPQFETIGGFDPYRQFLNGKPHGAPDFFEFTKEGDHWMIKCGAIHGIPVRPTTPITIEIKAFGPGGALALTKRT